MKVLLAVFALVAVSQARQSRVQQFNDFKEKYQKKYNRIDEEVKRFNIFKSNVEQIEFHNSQRSSYSRAINAFTDLSEEEFKANHLGLKTFPSSSSLPRSVRARNASRDLPNSVNWVTEGAVTAVKDQGQCGSCWAFSLTSQVESYAFINTGSLPELSTQQVTSCTPNTLSCGGSGSCQGGVFDGCSFEENISINHGVQLVGYGTDYGPLGTFPYWLVRNSWGPGWGEDGYIRLKRTAECGMNSTPMDGTACVGGPGSEQQTVCGMCGMLLDTTFPLGVYTWPAI